MLMRTCRCSRYAGQLAMHERNQTPAHLEVDEGEDDGADAADDADGRRRDHHQHVGGQLRGKQWSKANVVLGRALQQQAVATASHHQHVGCWLQGKQRSMAVACSLRNGRQSR